MGDAFIREVFASRSFSYAPGINFWGAAELENKFL
jgi:hypothetical protein